MAKFEKVGKGAVFTREKTNEKQPDFGGSLTIRGEEIQVSMWKSRTKKGDPYLSIQLSRKIEEDTGTSGPWDNENKEQAHRKDAQ